MRIPRGVDKKLVQEAIELGGFRTQSAAVRAALLSYIARRLPKGQSIEIYLAQLQVRIQKKAGP